MMNWHRFNVIVDYDDYDDDDDDDDYDDVAILCYS